MIEAESNSETVSEVNMVYHKYELVKRGLLRYSIKSIVFTEKSCVRLTFYEDSRSKSECGWESQFRSSLQNADKTKNISRLFG